VGVHELQPGVWVGLHTHVPPEAKLIPPCWIEERVWIEPGATIGPNAVLEKEVVVSRGAAIAQSLVGPQTFVGQFTEVHNSIAWGSTLVNWERDSCLKVPDEFMLCSLQPNPAPSAPAKSPSRLRILEYVSDLWTSMFAEIGPPR
jgi:carbonic anhydrase/acetyltransferase-like protein (isoleucine patch superfamily)